MLIPPAAISPIRRERGAFLRCLNVLLALLLVAAMRPAAAATLDSVKARGELICGISDQVPGFGFTDRYSRWSGMDVDFCRAVAAAVLGSEAKAVFKPVTRAQGLRALAAGQIDLLSQASSWTLSQDTEFSVRFVDVLVFDGQGFLVPKSLGLSSALELSGASICVVGNTRTQEVVAGFFGRHRMHYKFVKRDNWTALLAEYRAGNCGALAGDVTQLAGTRSKLDQPAAHAILPELISKEPLAPAVRIGDPNWFAIVRWVLRALIEAEELGVGKANVASMAASPIDDIRRLLGVGSSLGHSLGLDVDWARRAIAAVGNYGELYERNLGSGSDLQLARGYNKLWLQGGLMYGVPLR